MLHQKVKVQVIFTQEASSWLGEDFIDDPSGRAVRSHINSVI